MNNVRRKKLKEAEMYAGRIKDIISDVLDEERDCLDNTPENLQSNDRYLQSEETADNLEDSLSLIDEIIDTIQSACSA